MKRLAERVGRWARLIRRDAHALHLAARDPRVPWYAKAPAIAVAAYALSPIDLIPDAVPVLGYLDDLILVPLGMLLAIRLVPSDVMAECREMAASHERPASRRAAIVIVLAWIACVLVAGWLAWCYRAT